MCLAAGKKTKGSGIAVVDSIFNDSAERMSVLGSKKWWLS